MNKGWKQEARSKKREANRPFCSRRLSPFRSCNLGHFFVFAVMLTFIVVFNPKSAGHANESNDSRPVSSDTAPAAEPEKSSRETEPSERAASALWPGYIWESLPTLSLAGNDFDQICETYQKNAWKPIFINSRFELNGKAEQLLSRLRTLENDAIDSRPFRLSELSQNIERLDQSRSTLRTADPELKDTRAESLTDAQPSDPSPNQSGDRVPSKESNSTTQKKYQETFMAAGETDIRLTRAFLLFAKEMNPYFQQEEASNALLGETPIAKFIEQLEPRTFNYQAIRSAYAKYKKLAAQGGQQRVALLSKVRRGESGYNIRDLQKRLQQEDFYSGQITGVYDEETQRGVKEFQAAHLLDPDGVIGERTKQWLNVSFQDKANLIAQAMRAERQSSSRQYSRFIRINIPQFMLEFYKDEQFQEAHRIVVGKATGKQVKFRGKMVGENQTPTLTSSIEQLILNPRWYVSDRIRLELDGEAKSDPDWFEKHGYVSMTSRYPWGAHRIFQSPGPKNALGRVKFEFPNPYAVYLHDTPLKHLFVRPRRDFSHGCIRVDKAVGLAETLLKDDKSPYAEKMKSVLDGSRQVFVKLSQPVPICIEYIPVVAASNSQIVFAGDLYGIYKEGK